MAMVPITYPIRSLFVRLVPTLFSAFGIACTAGVIVGVLGLREGFATLFDDKNVPEDVLIYMRPGAQSEGESAIRKDQAEVLKKSRNEVVKDADGVPQAAAETYLAVNVEKVGGGMTNAPIRGIEPTSPGLAGPSWKLVEGVMLKPGTNQLVVGRAATRRIAHCSLHDTVTVEGQPFEVVGIFEHDGVYATEIWGDSQRLMDVLKRPFYQRVIARVKPGTDAVAIAKEIENDKQIPAKVLTMRAYLAGQKTALVGQLTFLGKAIGLIMGLAAVLGATTTMLAGVGSRTREVGMLLAIGFGRGAIFIAFLIESATIGLFGGVVGCAVGAFFNGKKTGTTNPKTFTETAFELRVTPTVLVIALALAVILGVVGGALPAWRASRLRPTEALRRH